MSARGFVYVIGAEDSTVGPVKIGYTDRSVEERLSALQTGAPVILQIISVLRASAKVERRIHAMCAEYRLHGEWFERKGPVLEIIRKMLCDPDSLAGIENDQTSAIWVPDEIDKCPAASGIWVLLRQRGVQLRSVAEGLEA